jgi:hypothetical protein
VFLSFAFAGYFWLVMALAWVTCGLAAVDTDAGVGSDEAEHEDASLLQPELV